MYKPLFYIDMSVIQKKILERKKISSGLDITNSSTAASRGRYAQSKLSQ
jgi:hypothetical protein